jgi:hypothetical protein
MIAIALVAVGVPLWLCALAIFVIYRRNRELRRRPGNVPVRFRHPARGKWLPGHGVWAHDVFAFRGSPAAWKEALFWVIDATVRPASEAERKDLHRIGEYPIVSRFTLASGGSVEVAARDKHIDALLGPFAPDRMTNRSLGAPTPARTVP